MKISRISPTGARSEPNATFLISMDLSDPGMCLSFLWDDVVTEIYYFKNPFYRLVYSIQIQEQ